MKMSQDDANALRMALEPLTHPAVESRDDSVFAASIAISLKRIADAMEKDQALEAIVVPAPIIAFEGHTGHMIVSHPAWDHAFKVLKGVVLIDDRYTEAAFIHGWQSAPRATTKQETDLGLIRVFRIGEHDFRAKPEVPPAKND